MRKKIITSCLGFILVASLALPFYSCTGYLDFRGHVYEWTNAPAGRTSEIIEADELPDGVQVKPISGVTVEANDEDESHPFQMVSDAEGEFHKGLTVEFSEDIIVKVNHPGYGRASLQFDVDKDKYFYSLIVLLVPEK